MPVLINPGLLKPIPPNSDVGICINCAHQRARWIFKKLESWCSYCFLHKTDWGRENRDQIVSLAKAVSNNLGRSILDENNDILVDDSDRILASVVFTSLYKYNKSRPKQ